MWNTTVSTTWRRRRHRWGGSVEIGAAPVPLSLLQRVVVVVVALIVVVADVTEAWMTGNSISNQQRQYLHPNLILLQHLPLGGWTLLRHMPSSLTRGHSVITITGKVPLPFFSTSTSTKTSTALYMAALPEGYQEFGTFLIQKVAKEQFGMSNDKVSIEWKPGRIIVTVHGDVYLSNDDNDDDDDDNNDIMDGMVEEEEEEEEADYNVEETIDDDLDGDELALEVKSNETERNDDDDDIDDDEEILPTIPTSIVSSTGVDVTQFARAINVAFDDDAGGGGGVGCQIAATHEIEVTTPGASNTLSGIMFKSYRGFEVMTEFQDAKTHKVKTIIGRLVGRDDEFTIINIKGRMKKIKNTMVVSVKLPKAKKERGAA